MPPGRRGLGVHFHHRLVPVVRNRSGRAVSIVRVEPAALGKNNVIQARRGAWPHGIPHGSLWILSHVFDMRQGLPKLANVGHSAEYSGERSMDRALNDYWSYGSSTFVKAYSRKRSSPPTIEAQVRSRLVCTGWPTN